MRIKVELKELECSQKLSLSSFVTVERGGDDFDPFIIISCFITVKTWRGRVSWLSSVKIRIQIFLNHWVRDDEQIISLFVSFSWGWSIDWSALFSVKTFTFVSIPSSSFHASLQWKSQQNATREAKQGDSINYHNTTSIHLCSHRNSIFL